MSKPDNYLAEVRRQYEALPYPPCNPEDDRTRMVLTWLEDLPMINHYCFAGKQSFQNNFRALVAGGGTGDATIFLAEQLKTSNAEVVHLDMSQASIKLAQRRAEIRGLSNITWVHASLLDLPTLGLGKFDYINCSGVLHHLANPDAGLQALRSVLKEGDPLACPPERPGAIGLMVYATVGRTGVYQMQALMRMVNQTPEGPIDDAQGKIAQTRDLLAGLPASNWFKLGERLHHDHNIGDAGIYDLLLHPQDRSYSVGELFDWLQTGNGMHLEFTDVQRGRSSYLPHMVLGSKPPDMTGALRKRPRRQQYEMAELMSGSIITHSLYATESARCTAPYGDAQYIPFFFHEPLTGDVVAQVFASNKGQPFMLNHQHSGATVMVNPGKYAPQILRLIDGKRSFGEIFEQFRGDWRGKALAPTNDALFADFAESYDTLNAIDRLLLTHPIASPALPSPI